MGRKADEWAQWARLGPSFGIEIPSVSIFKMISRRSDLRRLGPSFRLITSVTHASVTKGRPSGYREFVVSTLSPLKDLMVYKSFVAEPPNLCLL